MSGDDALMVSERTVGGVLVVSVRGELDLSTAAELAAHVDAARAGGRARRVVLDLVALGFCDSAGLRAVLGAADEVRAAGGRLAVVVDDGPVARVLEITGVSEWLELHAHVPPA